MHNFDLEFPPCIVAEITVNNGLIDLRRENLEELVIKDLVGLGIIPTADHVALTDTRTIHYTYPIHTVGLNKLKGELASTLERNNLYILGRSGRWDYLNMDGVLSSVWEFLSCKLLRMYG